MRWLMLVAAVAAVAGCESPDDTAERFRERQRKYDPLQLWSIEVVRPEKSQPITICTDAFIREGFARPLPNYGGKQCALHEPPTVSPGRITMHCTLNGHDYTVRSWIKGDVKTAFDVDYAIQGPGPTVRQVRRHKLLGPCPAGWDIGDNTDREGRLRQNAMH